MSVCTSLAKLVGYTTIYSTPPKAPFSFSFFFLFWKLLYITYECHVYLSCCCSALMLLTFIMHDCG